MAERIRTRLSDRVIRSAITLAKIVIDWSAWIGALFLCSYIRFDIDIPDPDRTNLYKFLPIVCLVQLILGLLFGLYRRRWHYGSFDEVAALALTSAATTGLLYVADKWYLDPRLVPLSVLLMGGFVSLVLMAGVRYTRRLYLEWNRRPDSAGAARTLVFGAGDGGIQVITAMQRNRTSPYLPVGILDDDPAKRRLSIKGVEVVGTSADIAAAASRCHATTLLIAVPSASAELISAIVDAAQAAALQVKVLPPVDELFGSAPGLESIRPLSESDLLGRHQISTDVASIAGYLTGKRVLVTGAGGSIGSELCRQISQFGPAELMMLDRDESALHGVQLSIEGRALLDRPNVILADIRDVEVVKELFLERRPEVVFHAAALKHLPMLEQYPAEAFKSNVVGSHNVLIAAAASGVERFVNISTDKAANPISVLGYSKRIAERLTSHVASRAPGTYLSVRFGNVLGSRGSVLTTFRAQIDAGGPITVTDPNVTRYFMTVPEAVQLVIQAGAIGRPAEVLVLDMGRPVRIADVARRLAAQAPRPINIVYTGLRPGEKLHEDLLGDGEIDVRPRHPLISHTPVPPIDPADVLSGPGHVDVEGYIAWMSGWAGAARAH